MLAFWLAALACVVWSAFRWRDADGPDHDPARARWAGRAGHVSRLLLVPAACCVAWVDWRPTIARHASSDWLVRRATDEASQFQSAAIEEVARRLSGNECDGAALATIVRGLWTLRTSVEATQAPGAPLLVRATLIPPRVPSHSDHAFPHGRPLGGIEWRVVAAWLDGTPVPVSSGGPAQRTEARPYVSSTAQLLPATAGASDGGGTLRYEVAFAYRDPGGTCVGPAWSATFVQPVDGRWSP